MGVGGGTGVGGGVQPPQVRETETIAFVEVSKKALAMLQEDTFDVTPFTQAQYDSSFKYRSEADRPTLPPLYHLRHASLKTIAEEGTWQPLYQEFLDVLPPEIREQLLQENQRPFAERDPAFVAIDQVLKAAAIAVTWLTGVTGPIEPNSPKESNYVLNLALPYIMLRESTNQAETVLNAAQLWLEQIGPNDPNYDSLTHFVGELSGLLSELNVLRQEIEQGHESYDLTLRLEDLANRFNQLYDHFENTGLGEELPILRTVLDNLTMISSAWALGLDSSPLLIGMYIAFTGFSQETSGMGMMGPGFQTLLDGLNEGLLDVFSFGPASELGELNELDHDLVELRDT